MQSRLRLGERRAAAALRAPSGRHAWRPTARGLAVVVRAEKVMIVNTKKGGHAFLGLYLAKQLDAAGHSVTIFNDGDESLESKPPFSAYSTLPNVNVIYGDPKNPETYPQLGFDVIYDNNGKSLEECGPLIDHYCKQVQQFCFVGSAGAYLANASEPMHVEGDERKASAGHKKVEDYLEKVGVPYTVFHPLYMYGEHTAKDCEQWFIDRIIRDRPVPIPWPGVQLTSVSHVEDVAGMMAAACLNPKAFKQHYNACSDRTYTLDGVAQSVAKALGKDADIVHYTPGAFDIPKGKGFPFRDVHFFASTDKAKRDLGWKPAGTLEQDLPAQVEEYKKSGRASRVDIDFSVDDMIIGACRG